MASTYVNDLRLNEMATGDASGSWGTVTNTNLELIGEAFSYGTETIGDADSTLTIADGASDPVRSFFLKITSSVDLTTTRIVTIAPNTVSKVWMIENATTGSQVITIKQGSGATINVPNGQVKMISTDGAGSGGAVLDLLVDVDLTGTTTLVNLDVSGAVDIAGDLTLSAGGDGALRFTAASSVKVLDNDAAALVFEEADNAYMTFVTTDGSEAVKFDKALDINAATQIDATVTVGVDDTGYDVKFFGATAGAYMLWDESADTLEVSGTVTADGLTVDGGNTIRLNAASGDDFLTIDQGAAEATITANSAAGNANLVLSTTASGAVKERVHIAYNGDISFYEATGTTANFFWDASLETLTLGGTEWPTSNIGESAGRHMINYDGEPRLLLWDASTGAAGNEAHLMLGGKPTSSATIISGGSINGGVENASDADGYLAFNTTNGAGTFTEAMRIDSSGNVLVATTTLGGTGGWSFYPIGSGSSPMIVVNKTNVASTTAFSFQVSGVAKGSISYTSTATAFNTSSDYRLKTDAQPMTGASDRVLALKPVNFEWISDGSRVDGFLAHEAQSVVPECVTGTKDAMRDEEYEVTAAVEATYDEDSNELTAAVPAVMGTRSIPDYQGIDQSKLVPLLTAALQEALTEISALKARVTALEG
jgi:hypothetical protein